MDGDPGEMEEENNDEIGEDEGVREESEEDVRVRDIVDSEDGEDDVSSVEEDGDEEDIDNGVGLQPIQGTAVNFLNKQLIYI